MSVLARWASWWLLHTGVAGGNEPRTITAKGGESTGAKNTLPPWKVPQLKISSQHIYQVKCTSLKIILATNRSTFLSKTIAIPHETLDRVHCKAVAWRHSINTPSLGDTSVSSSLCVDCFRLADSGEYVAVDCWDFDSLKELDLALFSPPVACSLYKWNSLFSFRSLWRRSIGTIYTIELLKRCQCVELAPWRQIDGLLRILGSPDLDDYIPKPLNKKSHWSNVPRWSL